MRDDVTVESVGYRAFDFARAFAASDRGAVYPSTVEFLARLERWAFDPEGAAPQQKLLVCDRVRLIARIRDAVTRSE